MSQIQVKAISRASREFAHRLRISLGATAELVDKCGSDFADEIHEFTCKRLGLDPASDNNAGHPWRKRKFFERQK